MWTMPLLAFDYLTVTVSSVRYTKHCVDCQPSEHSICLHGKPLLIMQHATAITVYEFLELLTYLLNR